MQDTHPRDFEALLLVVGFFPILFAYPSSLPPPSTDRIPAHL